MCGRFVLSLKLQELLGLFPSSSLPNWKPSFNIAPQADTPLLVGGKSLHLAKWGFFAPSINKLVINARAESLKDKVLFESLWPKNRCAVIANGFYEWQGKTPYYVQKKDHSTLYFGGIYRFVNGKPEYVILTQDAGKALSKIHHRKPVMLSKENLSVWFSKDYSESLPVNEEVLDLYPVSLSVNKTTFDGPECIQKKVSNERDLFLDL